MTTIKFSWSRLQQDLPAFAPVPVPLGEQISQVRSISAVSEDRPSTRAGVWECTPGKWVRQVRQAEFCHFLEGHAIFYPADGSSPMTIKAGDVVYFPENSAGEWEIIETSRKIFLLFSEGTAA